MSDAYPMESIGTYISPNGFCKAIMRDMEKELAVAAGTGTLKQTFSTEGKCPVVHGSRRPHPNADWWPNQLDLKVLHQNSPLSDPMGEAFNYAKEFMTLDLNANQ